MSNALYLPSPARTAVVDVYRTWLPLVQVGSVARIQLECLADSLGDVDADDPTILTAARPLMRAISPLVPYLFKGPLNSPAAVACA